MSRRFRSATVEGVDRNEQYCRMKALPLLTFLGLLAGCQEAVPPSPLVDDLEHLSADEAGAELNQRLAKRFPLGMREDQLVDQLDAEGFRVGPDDSIYCETPRCAVAEWWPESLGGVIYTIYWSADPSGRVTRVWTSGRGLLN